MSFSDQYWMETALQCAKQAEVEGEVPVGAVVVCENRVIGKGWNQTIQLHDPSAHAEVIALRDAGKELKNYRVLNSTLYVTLEPCAMCIGAIVHARIQRVVFGATDLKTGVLGGAVNMVNLPHWNHQFDFTKGILAEACGKILVDFFQKKRL